LMKTDRFHGKLVSFLFSVTVTGLDKHTSLDKHIRLLQNQ
jgi:hypothetical protein